jgi:hypothetical protein
VYNIEDLYLVLCFNVVYRNIGTLLGFMKGVLSVDVITVSVAFTGSCYCSY